ncbi:hypothetical protein PRCB_14305 [Pantoea rodasii]|uniref:Uncharacterized protein n=1 Tax=Pantoea rodasii TaxID=1076549 RepID=A0A2M9WAQ0_9GAMM|nr:hypothetical protein HA45_03295 [Pantoea rodasii]PJZ04605.1 hypothetical protein PRCB_14305 [Pantoea rodasii]
MEARAPLLLQGLSAALRLLRWARSQAQGCDWQFGLAWMALPELNPLTLTDQHYAMNVDAKIDISVF